jgi:hypothetical protein
VNGRQFWRRLEGDNMLSTLVVRVSKLRLGIIYSQSYIECVFVIIMNVNKGVKWWYAAEMGSTRLSG